jgi:hypothetical protein
VNRGALTIAILALSGCATHEDESGVRVDLTAEGQHPGYVALKLYVADKPFGIHSENACYELTSEQSTSSRGLAKLNYDGHRLAGTLLNWGDVNYDVDLELGDRGVVTGEARFAVGSMVRSSPVSGRAKPLRNFDLCRRLAQDIEAAERAEP